MTLLESLVATIMLVVFTGVVALVMQFTLRFFNVAESGDRNEFDVSNGVLIDHQQIQMAMDDLVEVLSQPGISLERLNGQERCSADDPPSSCTACTDNFDESCRPQIALTQALSLSWLVLLRALPPNGVCQCQRFRCHPVIAYVSGRPQQWKVRLPTCLKIVPGRNQVFTYCRPCRNL